ncbi:hypothetical protein [Methylocucumis oryzae]|uniref:Uncharacterized protein n=1 Tax=Methylocucumis oryzae TaxID=1632867 RepID=A0A0F3IEL8_9GAMM|nr:hypothetical protein [Methylocucumis oryzae]KJV04988.1 hypothetical protein VZ94_21410 [Methylocucumis oryzae]
MIKLNQKLGRFAEQEFIRWRALIEEAVINLSVIEVSKVKTSSGETNKSVNRRLKWRFPTFVRISGRIDSDIYTCDNPSGIRDSLIRIFMFKTNQSKVAAIVWTFACHPVGFPEPDTVSADFVGVVRERLRKIYGPQVPVIFAPGCMGDVRPRSPGTWKTLSNIARCAIFGPTAPGFNRQEWDRWANELADEVVAIANAGKVRFLKDDNFPAISARLPLAEFFNGYTPVSELSCKAVSVPGSVELQRYHASQLPR